MWHWSEVWRPGCSVHWVNAPIYQGQTMKSIHSEHWPEHTENWEWQWGSQSRSYETRDQVMSCEPLPRCSQVPCHNRGHCLLMLPRPGHQLTGCLNDQRPGQGAASRSPQGVKTCGHWPIRKLLGVTWPMRSQKPVIMGVTSEQLGPDCQTLLQLLRVYTPTPVKHNIQIWNYGLIEYLHGLLL